MGAVGVVHEDPIGATVRIQRGIKRDATVEWIIMIIKLVSIGIGIPVFECFAPQSAIVGYFITQPKVAGLVGGFFGDFYFGNALHDAVFAPERFVIFT